MPMHEVEVGYVLTKFFTLWRDDAGASHWQHGRCEDEITHYQDKVRKASEAGKSSGRQRLLNGRSTNVQPTNNHEPITNNQLNTEPTVLVPSPDGEVTKVPRVTVPYGKLVDAYHAGCPMLPQIVQLSDTRKKVLGARFKQVMLAEKWDAHQTMQWFTEFYGRVSASKFLTGRARPSKDGRTFVADWDWIHGPQNFMKIIEGRYNNGE
jgi:hypothetical protein